MDITVSIVEDNDKLRETLARALNRAEGFRCVSEYPNAEDALKGLPGIYSARYAGEGASTQENNQKLLREMNGIPISKRGARFKCVISVVSQDGKEAVAEGSCKGTIGFEEKGKKGFGYDPLFILPKYGKTMAELSLEEKNEISHRGKALRKISKIIKTFKD